MLAADRCLLHASPHAVRVSCTTSHTPSSSACLTRLAYSTSPSFNLNSGTRFSSRAATHASHGVVGNTGGCCFPAASAGIGGVLGPAVNAAFKGTMVVGHLPAGYAVPHLAMSAPPDWNVGQTEKHNILLWDSEQVIVEVVVNDTVVCSCNDTGACRTLMSIAFA